jgi:hypothetical protein
MGNLLTCKLNNTSANYKANTKHNKIQNSTNTKDKTLKKQNKYVVKQYKTSTGPEIQYLTERR